LLYFTHALTSCWNHGNAHFLRGILRALTASGHTAIAYEPEESWSRSNLVQDQGSDALTAFASQFPDLTVRTYRTDEDLQEAVRGADVVIVHEWTDASTVAALGRLRARGAPFTLFFHDTHHRAVSDPAAMRAFDLSGYDAVLAFGATLAAIYEKWGWGNRVFVWHEAADTSIFRPPTTERPRSGIIWIGNWGDGERTAELETFLLSPAKQAGLSLDIHGVRYPQEARAMLQTAGARYHGWIANACVPDAFARHAMTVHVPRRFYTTMLPGIPTIRVFEALACGIPLICAPWTDSENLFRPGEDYLTARTTPGMTQHMRSLANDPNTAQALINSGLGVIESKHSCAIRVHQLMAIIGQVKGWGECAIPPRPPVATLEQHRNDSLVRTGS
jgi:spore maturation protein CgeB